MANASILQEPAPEPSAAARTKVRFKSDEASDYLAAVHGLTISPRTLDKLRCVGGGPEFQKFGRAVLYQRDALDSGAAAKLGRPLRSTSDVGEAA